MLTIKMLSDKSLVITKPMKIYQRQSMVDNMQILVDPHYNDEVDLSNFAASIEYIDPANTAHMELLSKDEELYNDKFLRYTLPIDSKFTYMAGNIVMKLTFTYDDPSTSIKYVLRSGELIITILKLNDYFAFVDSDSLSEIENKIMNLQIESDKLAAIAEIYAEKQPDDLTMNEEAKLQLSANGTPIGDGVYLASPVVEYDDKEDGVIDINDTDNTDNNEIAVIEL